MQIKPETADDIASIFDVHAAAFKRDVEARLVDMLRGDGDLLYSHIALKGDSIIGHIALSPMQIIGTDVRALGLGPIGVLPKHQGSGVGSKLMHQAIDWAKRNDWQMIMLLGNPTYYGRFGFSVDAAKPFVSSYSGPYWQALMLDESVNKPQSAMAHYAPAFGRL